MRRLALPRFPFERRLLYLVHKIIEIERPIINHLLHLGHLHLSILIEELLDRHKPAPDAHDQSPRDELHVDLPRAEYVVAVAESLNGHRLSQRIEVLGYQLIDEIALDWTVPGDILGTLGLVILRGGFFVRGGIILFFV